LNFELSLGESAEYRPNPSGTSDYKLSDAELLCRIERDPKLLRLPLIRGGKLLSVGHDEDSWKAML
jgi:arsenate reductase-like glutaredoxin family protein